MTSNDPPNEMTDAIRQHSARMRRFLTILWAFCAVLVVLERFSNATIQLVRSDFAAHATRKLACEAVSAFPEALFLLGLWWVRDTLSAFARGELFAPNVTLMLDRVGIVLAVGSAIRILIVPGLCRLLGFGWDYWIAFDASALVLGAIGLSLKTIAGVLRRASAIESELDEIF
jgi:hypothetical protein